MESKRKDGHPEEARKKDKGKRKGKGKE